jgi:hypothetical protein
MRRLVLTAVVAAALTPALALAGGQQQFPTQFQQLKFKASVSKIVFSGTLASAEDSCLKGRKAKLIRKHNGNTKTLASDKSDKHGDFKMEVTDPPVQGKFYGKIKQKTIGSGAGKIICLERETASVTITAN